MTSLCLWIQVIWSVPVSTLTRLIFFRVFLMVFTCLELFRAFLGIGYFPPWPLLLGLIYRVSFNVIPNIFLYNFAIKVPVIVGNVGLAYLMKKLIIKLYGDDKKARFVWLFILFNPFVLLTTVAWGEFDTIVALLCVASLYLSSTGKGKGIRCFNGFRRRLKTHRVSASWATSPPSSFTVRCNKCFEYVLIFVLVLGVCYFAPFYLEGWALPWSSSDWTTDLRMAGGMTFFN